MGYFDYLDEEREEKKDFAYYDVWAKAGLYASLGSLAIIVLTAILFLCAQQIGSSWWVSIFNTLGMGAGIFAIVASIRATSSAKKKRQVSMLGRFALAWALLWTMVNATLILINLWVYFS